MENGAASLIYTFRRSGSVSSALTVNFTVGGSAILDRDYTSSGAGMFSGTIGTVMPDADCVADWRKRGAAGA